MKQEMCGTTDSSFQLSMQFSNTLNKKNNTGVWSLRASESV